MVDIYWVAILHVTGHTPLPAKPGWLCFQPACACAVFSTLLLLLLLSPAIEDEYSGPKLDNGKVTLAFMKELMQWYKDQKKLHRKCAYQVTSLCPLRAAPGVTAFLAWCCLFLKNSHYP